MKKILILLALLAPASGFAQIGASYIRTPDSSLAITNNTYPDDTLFKFTKDGFVLKYESNVPTDTVVWKSDAVSSDSSEYADTSGYALSIPAVINEDTVYLGSNYIATTLYGAYSVQSHLISNFYIGNQDGSDEISFNFGDRLLIAKSGVTAIEFQADSVNFYGGSSTIKENKISSDTLSAGGDTITGTTDAKTYIEEQEFDSLNTDYLTVDSTIYFNLPHAALYRSTDLTISASQDVWYNITGLTTKDADNITIVSDSCQIPKGSFIAILSMSFSGNNGETWEYGVFKNGVLEEPSKLRYTGNNDTGDVTCPVYFESDGDDWITFKIRNITDNDDPTIKRFSAIISTEHLEK